jgi:hypothetical protein
VVAALMVAASMVDDSMFLFTLLLLASPCPPLSYLIDSNISDDNDDGSPGNPVTAIIVMMVC